MRPLESRRGQIPLDAIRAALRPEDVHLPRSRLLILEQTNNLAGGSVLPLEYLREVRAFCDDAGFYHFVDRRKDMIKRGGENIAPSEVEGVIKQLDAVLEVAVVGAPDPLYDEIPKAFVILRPGGALTAEEILAHCRRSLTRFKVPTSITFCDEFPKTSVGKIQKHQLPVETGE